MNNHAIRTTRLTDRQIVDLIIAIREGIGFDSAELKFGVGVTKGITAGTAETELEKYKSDSHAILSLNVHSNHNILILFRRGVCPDSDTPDTDRQASPYFDEIFISSRNRNKSAPSPDIIIECLDIIEKTLHEVPRTLEGQGQDVIDTLRVEMSALNETYRRIHKDFADQRNEFLKGFEEQRQSVEEDRRTTKAKLEAEAEQRQQDFQKRTESEEAKLSQRQTELDEREKELDNRQHMHVRRELREKIIEEFKRRGDAPIVPKSAGRMRWGVFWISLIVGVGLVGFGLWTFYLLFTYPNTLVDEYSELVYRLQTRDLVDQLPARNIEALLGPLLTRSYWLLMARAVVSTLVGSGLFFYAIRWLRNIYLEDVQTIRHYDSYRDDIDRASFAIETIMEISGEREGVTVPDAWIEGVCRNLFRSDIGNKAESSSQADAFIELLRSFSSASVGPNGAEVTLDRKSGKRLAKTISAGGE